MFWKNDPVSVLNEVVPGDRTSHINAKRNVISVPYSILHRTRCSSTTSAAKPFITWFNSVGRFLPPFYETGGNDIDV